jgi:hypothetical protein
VVGGWWLGFPITNNQLPATNYQRKRHYRWSRLNEKNLFVLR